MQACSIEIHRMIGFRGDTNRISSWFEIVIEKDESCYPDLYAMENNYGFIVYRINSNLEDNKEKLNQYIEEDN